MAKSFEELNVYQKARNLTNEIYAITRKAPFAKDFSLLDQLRRAAVSVISNIAEGFERGGDKEFVQFLSISKGSCGEVKSHLYVALDQQYIDSTQFNRLYNSADGVGRLLAGFMVYLRQSDLRGRKFK